MIVFMIVIVVVVVIVQSAILGEGRTITENTWLISNWARF